MKKLQLLGLLLLVFLLPEWALAATYYVRPGFDSMRNVLTYGTATGADWTNAISGLTRIDSGSLVLAPDDIVCFPAGDEIFYGEKLVINDYSGTAGHPITFRGCGVSRAKFWSASDLTGDRSYTSAKAPVNGAAYAWVEVAPDIYKKRVDYRLQTLWEDGTWLEPMYTGFDVQTVPGGGSGTGWPSINTFTEAEIINGKVIPLGFWGTNPGTGVKSLGGTVPGLPPGKWGNSTHNGVDPLYVYYHATAPGKNPTNTTIRSNSVPFNADTLVQIIAGVSYITLEDIEVIGHTTLAIATRFAIDIDNASHITLNRVLVQRGAHCVNLHNFLLPSTDIAFNDVDILDCGGSALTVALGGGSTLKRFTSTGGSYSYSNGFYYDGTKFIGGDGDGIGIGYQGGDVEDFVIQGATINGNWNAGVFFGTAPPMKLTNLSILSTYMYGNQHNCYGEGGSGTCDMAGTFLVSGVVCAHTIDNTGMHYYGPAKDTLELPQQSGFVLSPNQVFGRDVTLENITFVGNRNKDLIRLQDEANNHFHLRNIVFFDNPSSTCCPPRDTLINAGDISIYGLAEFDPATDTFESLFFASAINQHKKIAWDNQPKPETAFYYDSPANINAFNALLRCSTCIYNVDPLFVSSTNYHPLVTSPLRNAGTWSATCRYVDGTMCDMTPDIGAYRYVQTVTPPEAPTGLRLVSLGSSVQQYLVWPQTSDTSIAGYRVYRGTTSGQATTLLKTITAASAAASYTPMTQAAIKLPVAGTYYYTIAAFNLESGAPNPSGLSNEVTVVSTGKPARTARP